MMDVGAGTGFLIDQLLLPGKMQPTGAMERCRFFSTALGQPQYCLQLAVEAWRRGRGADCKPARAGQSGAANFVFFMRVLSTSAFSKPQVSDFS